MNFLNLIDKNDLVKCDFIIGIDEAGRGPWAGPVSIAAVAAIINPKLEIRNSKQFSKFKTLPTGRQVPNSKFLRNIKDSKQLNARQRNEWQKIIKNNFVCHCVLISHEVIDKKGIAPAIREGVEKVIKKLEKSVGINYQNCFVLLDGALKAPKQYSQQTIIKGDEKISIISAASIIAKTTRDSLMLKYHKKYPQYCFDKHKGYGTRLHRQMLCKYGVCPIHRRSYEPIKSLEQ